MSHAEIATGRSQSFFAQDLEARHDELTRLVSGSRILAVGAAGSIGSNTVFSLCRYAPKAIHVVDQNENALAELVRQFRSSEKAGLVDDFRTLPLDYGAPTTRRLIESEGPYDFILNFAAIKHVRSEKDPFSILQMLDTNIVKQARFMGWISELSPKARYFSVSTDKAANPSSFMGATKRLMEHVMFDGNFSQGMEGAITSARFANVAFSNGSLLQAFENRMARREPIACPADIRRYFVSLEESGQICTLAALLYDDKTIGIPRLDPEKNLVLLSSIAENFITQNGYEPKIYTQEEDAKANCAADIENKHWPLILTKGDTAGEKPFEEFIAKGEIAQEVGLTSMQGIAHQMPQQGSTLDLVSALEPLVTFQQSRTAPSLDKDDVKDLIGTIEPAFLKTHKESALNLDQRM